MKKINKIHIYLLTFIIILVALILFNNTKNTPDKITLAVAKQPVMALVFIAEEKGYFKEEGLDVAYKNHILGRDALEDVIHGKADLATVYDIPVIRSIYEGEDLGILTTLHSSTHNHAIAAYKNKGITSIKDLKGKKIAAALGTSTDFFLYSALENEGINRDEVTVINTGPENLIPVFEKNSVDAVVVFNPYLYNLQKKVNKKDLTLLYSDAYQDESLLVGNKEYIKQNENKIIKVLKALEKADIYAKNNKNESIGIVDKYLSDYDSKGARANWDSITLSLGLNNRLITTLERETKFLYNTGIYKNYMPDIKTNIMPGYLKIVNPELVTIY